MTLSNKLIKSKSRVRDHGEVFTPDHIVADMLNLVSQETQRIESRFLEPACGDGNFLIQVLERKISVINKKYKNNHFDYQKYVFLAVSSIYGIDLLSDNILVAQDRLYDIIYEHYHRIYKKDINKSFLSSICFVLSKNIIQGDALSLSNDSGQPLVFSEWSFVTSSQIKRREYIFEELVTIPGGSGSLFNEGNALWSDKGETVFLPKPVREYPTYHFLVLPTHDD